MTRETILTNAAVVAPEELFQGTVVISGDLIKCVDRGASSLPGAVDLEKDLLIPGLIELHTDNLEGFLMPRPKVKWPSALTALMAHDALISSAGITTVLDSIFLGTSDPVSPRPHLVEDSIAAIRTGAELGVARAEHFIHLRCELPDDDLWPLFQKHHRDPNLKLVSLNDHTPGQRQWRDMESFRNYHRADHMSEEKIQAIIDKRIELQEKNLAGNRKKVLRLCGDIGVPLASHDDTTEKDILEAAENGVAISEFPTTFEAAFKAHEKGLKNICGGPNLVRGRSHSANVSARELAQAGLLDAVSSDYYPAGLLESVFILLNKMDYSLPRAVATVTSSPADMVGLSDRGRIQEGKRADLVQVRQNNGLPLVLHSWRSGRQRF